MSAPRNRQEKEKREHKVRAGVVVSCVVVGLISIVACGYGHAAVSRELMVSGEGTVVGNPTTFGITYMQEMTPKVCEKAGNYTEEQLIDQRDGQKYWVIKLENGYCWMEQDLRLMITPEGLTGELSDINESSLGRYDIVEASDGRQVYAWNENSYYPPTNTFILDGEEKIPTTTSNFTKVYSYDFGEYVINDPTKTAACATNSYGPSQCPDTVTPVNGLRSTLSYNETGSTVQNGEYDARYKLGTYYTFITAAAGSYRSGTSGRGLTAPSSICPRGWKLPSTSGNGGAEMTPDEVISDSSYASYEWPYSMTRGGYIQTTNLYLLGNGAAYLTNYTMPSDSSHVYTIGTNYNTSRLKTYYASTVRCVARMETVE